jgi:hypothetical protein
LESLVVSSGIATVEADKVLRFLLYYGIIGLRTQERDIYIYDVNYDAKMLEIRVQRAGGSAQFVVNAAFWPALGIAADA